ncbi:glycine zipper 2TM domain-containing protein [Chitinibacter sp. SCUT-21]|uniref:glycine zipper 2TM domain-containing protein n=1 Tax=Chitinibacter sp. SCUT-21 TaxID=2970891 RepID=UPI0035A58387
MRQLFWVLIAALLVNTTAFADDDDDWDDYKQPKRWKQRDYAIIRSVTPQYERWSQPRQECSSEWVTENVVSNNNPNYTGTIIGGVAGGVLGHQVGKGRGKDVATVAGTLIGAMVGNHLSDPSARRVDPVQREVKRCREVNDYREQVRDYRVDYEYRSQIYSTTMTRYPGRPGARIPVKLIVELDD